MGRKSEKIYKMLLFSVLVGSSLSLPTLQRAERQYYQQQAYNQYPSNNQYNYQDWSSSSSPNVQINGNFNNDICNHQDKFFGDLLDLGKIRVLNRILSRKFLHIMCNKNSYRIDLELFERSTRWSLWRWRSFRREKWWWYGNEHEYARWWK